MRGLIFGLILGVASMANASGGYKMNSVSPTSFAATGTASYLTLSAMVDSKSAPVAILLSAEGASAFRWRITNSTTAPSLLHYQGLSLTAVLIDNVPRTSYLWLQSTGSATTVLVDVCEQGSPGY